MPSLLFGRLLFPVNCSPGTLKLSRKCPLLPPRERLVQIIFQAIFPQKAPTNPYRFGDQRIRPCRLSLNLLCPTHGGHHNMINYGCFEYHCSVRNARDACNDVSNQLMVAANYFAKHKTEFLHTDCQRFRRSFRGASDLPSFFFFFPARLF